MSTYILVVDDEPDVEHLFRQQFRRDIRNGRFVMEFAASAPEALERAKTIADPMLILILSDINMPDWAGNAAEGKGGPTERPRHHDHRLWRRSDKEEGD
jgi:CheY-like chemotaxis protein